MRCGGQALNLTCATRVLMIDVWWNEAAEDQAKCRVFRLGQNKETHCVRILARNTIDEYIKDMQDDKTERIEEVLQDDGHETFIKSEFEMMKIIDKTAWEALVTKLMAEIRQEEAAKDEEEGRVKALLGETNDAI